MPTPEATMIGLWVYLFISADHNTHYPVNILSLFHTKPRYLVTTGTSMQTNIAILKL